MTKKAGRGGVEQRWQEEKTSDVVRVNSGPDLGGVSKYFQLNRLKERLVGKWQPNVK